jgi:hypothetical protein
MNRIKYIYLNLFVYLWVVSIPVQSTPVQTMYFGITPPLVEKYVSPASKETFSLFLQNYSTGTLDLQGSVQSFRADNQSGELFFIDDVLSPHSCQGWIRLDPYDVILEPGENREIKVTVDVPHRIEGGYYAWIFFEPRSHDEEETDGAFSLTVRIGTTVVLKARGQQDIKARIISFTAEEELGHTVFKARLINPGNVHVSPEVNIVLFSDVGRVVDRLKFKDKSFIFPGSQKLFRLVWTNPLKREPGKSYSAECRFRIPGLGRSLREKIYFSVD